MCKKDLDKYIENLFLRYKTFKIRINSKFYCQNMQDQVEKMKEYIYLIDNLLDFFNKSEKEFIINVYINQVNYYDLCISESNFYYKKRKYNDKLYKLVENEKKWLQLLL